MTIAHTRTKLACKLQAASVRLSDYGKKIRLSRVLGGAGHRSLIVAFDHAPALGAIPGTEDPLGQIRRFAEADVDAILLNLGLIRQLASNETECKLPAVLARIDWSTIWSVLGEGAKELRSTLVARPEEALTGIQAMLP